MKVLVAAIIFFQCFLGIAGDFANIAEEQLAFYKYKIVFHENGQDEGRVSESLKPWSGYWWPEAEGKLFLGWQGESAALTPSKDIYKVVSSQYNNEELISYYKGKLTEKPFSKDKNIIAAYSPIDKWGAYTSYNLREFPFSLAIVEAQRFNPFAENWWGYCNGFAAASFLTKVDNKNYRIQGLLHYSDDIKAYFTVAFYFVDSIFWGTRYSSDTDNYEDLFPITFHKLLSFYIKDRSSSIIFDIDAGTEVWNFPAYQYISQYQRTDNNILRVITTVYYVSSALRAKRTIPFVKTYAYEFTLNGSGDIVGTGRWLKIRGESGVDSISDHPDFAWRPYLNPEYQHPVLTVNKIQTSFLKYFLRK